MLKTTTPLFVKENVIKEVREFVQLRRQQGFTVKSRIMFFSSLYTSQPKRVKVMVSAVKHDPTSIIPFMSILRRDGSWK